MPHLMPQNIFSLSLMIIIVGGRPFSSKPEAALLHTIKFYQQVDNTKDKIQSLQTDRKDEFMSTEFIKFCKHVGITHQVTVLHISYQNGFAEHNNCTIIDRARSMAIDAKLLHILRPKFVTTAT